MQERISFTTSDIARKEIVKGTEVVATKIYPQRIIPGNTARHEAAHIVAAESGGGIKTATIIRRGNVLGSVEPSRISAKTGAAAAALGFDGTPWDKFVVEYGLGVSWSEAKSAARAELAGQEEFMEEVASTLQKEKTINQNHVDGARKRIEERKQGIYPVKVEIYRAGKLHDSYTTKSFHGEVIVTPPVKVDLN